MAETKEKGKHKKLRITIIVICSVALAGLIAFGIFFLVQMNQTNKIGRETMETYLIPLEAEPVDDFVVDWDGLWAVNPDVCAWIRIPAIPDVSYPVVHYTDNDYYLRKSWQGDYLMSGCIMEDYHCSTDFKDFHTIVYGHNTVDTTMFGGLKQFQNQEFYDNNEDYIIIYTPDMNLYYKIFSVYVTDPQDPGVYTVGDFSRDEAFDYAENWRDSSEIETGIWADGDDYILTLSTCSGTTATKRLTVHAKLIEQRYPGGAYVSAQH